MAAMLNNLQKPGSPIALAPMSVHIAMGLICGKASMAAVAAGKDVLKKMDGQCQKALLIL